MITATMAEYRVLVAGNGNDRHLPVSVPRTDFQTSIWQLWHCNRLEFGVSARRHSLYVT